MKAISAFSFAIRQVIWANLPVEPVHCSIVNPPWNWNPPTVWMLES